MHHCSDYEPCVPCIQQEAYVDGVQTGAAVAFGLMGMAIEIRDTYLCRNCGSWEGRWGRCQCENDE